MAEYTEVVANKVKQTASKYRQHVQFIEFIICTLLVNALVITVSPGRRAKSQITFDNFQEIKKFSCCRTRIHLDCTLAYRYVLVVIPWIFYIPTNQVNKIEPWPGEQSHTVRSFKCLQQLLGQKEETIKWTDLEEMLQSYTHCSRNETQCTASGSIVERFQTRRGLRKLVRKPSKAIRESKYTWFRRSQRSTGRNKWWEGDVEVHPRNVKREKRACASEDNECEGRGMTYMKPPSNSMIDGRGTSQTF